MRIYKIFRVGQLVIEMGGGGGGSVVFTDYNNIERKVIAPSIFPKRGVGEAVCLTYML